MARAHALIPAAVFGIAAASACVLFGLGATASYLLIAGLGVLAVLSSVYQSISGVEGLNRTKTYKQPKQRTSAAIEMIPRRRITVAATTLVAALLSMDFLLFLLTLPSLQTDLGLATPHLAWVAVGFFFGFLFASLSTRDLHAYLSPRSLLIFAMGIFVLSSLVGATAASTGGLAVARLGQGMGGGLALVSALALLRLSFEGRDLSFGMALFGGGMGSGPIFAALVGGAVLELFDWQMIFVFEGLVAAATTALLAFVSSDSRPNPERTVNPVGALALCIALGGLAAGLIEASGWGLGSVRTIVAVSLGLVALLVFVFFETRVRSPSLPIHFLRDRPFLAFLTVNLFQALSSAAAFVLLVLYTQSFLDLSPLDGGFAFLPLAISAFVLSPLGLGLERTLGARITFVVSLGLLALGFLAFATLSSEGTYFPLLPGFVLVGLGLGLSGRVALLASPLPPPPHDYGDIAAVLNVVRPIGSLLGIAVAFAVVESSLGNHLDLRALSAGSLSQDFSNTFTVLMSVLSALMFMGALVVATLAPNRPAATPEADRTDQHPLTDSR